jgi:hypothetical protein
MRFTVWWRLREALELGGPTISKTYKTTWERIYLDLAELARLRWVENWKIEKLAAYFEVSRMAVKERLRTIKSNPKRAGLTASSF